MPQPKHTRNSICCVGEGAFFHLFHTLPEAVGSVAKDHGHSVPADPRYIAFRKIPQDEAAFAKVQVPRHDLRNVTFYPPMSQSHPPGARFRRTVRRAHPRNSRCKSQAPAEPTQEAFYQWNVRPRDGQPLARVTLSHSPSGRGLWN